MSTPLIAVLSCHQNLSHTEVQRATWAAGSVIPVKFFFGRAKNPRRMLPDEILLDVPDDYLSLPKKVIAMTRWVRANNFSHVFKADDDLYCRPERLLASGFELHSYIGKFCPPRAGYGRGFCHGGAGYWLGSKSLDIVATAPLPSIERSEDGHVANVLAAHGILARHDARYIYAKRVRGDAFPETPRADNNVICSAEFAPQEMGKVHRTFKGTDAIDQMSAADYRRHCLQHAS